MRVFLSILFAAVLQTPAFAQTPAQAETPGVEAARRIAATLQLAAQEYRLAWVNGALTKPDEWEEAKLFVTEAHRSAGTLPPAVRADVEPRIAAVQLELSNRMSPDSLAAFARDMEARLTRLLGTSLDDRPSREPSLDNGAGLYRTNCASCHGLSGRGDGPAAASIQPPPANFSDTAVLAATTPLDLYRKITLGVPGTVMPAWGGTLTREQRWDLVAHLLAFRDPAARHGRSGQVAVVFGTVRATLKGAMDATTRGDYDGAGSSVLDAYMAFEAVEKSLSATDPGIVSSAEARFSALRGAMSTRAPADSLARLHSAVLLTLDDAEHALTRTHSAAGLFVESLLLLLREGFEAILVVGAIMAVLVKADAKHKQRSVRWGVVAAVAASLVTAAILEVVFRVTPAQREALEGGIMILAAAILFYASYWLISKVEIAAWTRFVKGQIQRAVESGSGFALAGVAFLAVYREGFETVLFYKALYVTGGADGAAPITAGIIAGLAALVAVFVGLEKFGLKIPMRPFFAATGATLSFMAFVFAGDGVKELQEGGYIGSTMLSWAPRAEFFGIYPTLESLLVQLVILLAIIFGLVWTFVVVPRRLAALPPQATIPAPIERRDRRTESRQRSAKS